MGSKRTTRQERRAHIDKVALYKPFAFYAVVLAALNAAALTSGGEFSAVPSLASLVVGLLSWGLFEYSIHRWVLHREPPREGAGLPGNRTHLAHHADPNALDRLNVQLSESLPVCVVYFLAALALTFDFRAAVFAYDGLMLGYFFYEFLDYQAHHGAARGRVVRYYRRYHLMHHHYDARVRFGVTSPLFDYIFGTFNVERRTSPSRLLHETEA
ncbi:MAG TPA: sterol desaturase family protein [Pyrinomonadaceae bacterium]|jgi:sterol desaturase/sphingolipid hydroxylase (fatty acid hydroxylase superfamily)|nr:sterol desaturase family protein [Pyrinomonadaceae bacterium]